MPKTRVLVVEDEAIIGMDMIHSLESIGYDVLDQVRFGEEAVDVVNVHKPDIMLMDIILAGEIDGVETVKRIQENHDIPVIYLTAHGEGKVYERARETGPYGYLIKPVRRNDLYTAVETAIHRHELESKLRESESRYRIAFQTSPDSIIISKMDGTIVDLNDGFRQFTGYEHEEIVGKKKSNFKLWYNRKEDYEKFVGLLKNDGKINNLETSIQIKDGSIKTILISSSILEIDNKPHILSIVRDISERKEANDKIQNLNANLLAIMENTDDLLLISDKNAKPVMFNTAYEKTIEATLGRKMEPGLQPHKLLPDKEVVELWDNMHKRVLRGEKFRIDYSHEFSKGDIRHMEVAFHPILEGNRVTGFTEFTRDITERKQSEDSLKNRLRLNQLISDISNEMLSLSAEKIDIGINNALQKIAQFTGASLGSVFQFSDDLAKAYNTHEWCARPKDSRIKMLQEIPFDRFSYSAKKFRNNEIIIKNTIDDYPPEAVVEREWAKEHGSRSLVFVPLNKKGKLYGSLGFFGEVDKEIIWPEFFIELVRVFGDIIVNALERKQIEEKLLENKRLVESLMEARADIIVIIDKNGIIHNVNPAFARRLKTTVKKLLGSNVWEYIKDSPGIVKSRKAYVKKVINAGEAVRFEDERNGLWNDIVMYPILDNDKKVDKVAIFGRNITDNKLAKEKITEQNVLLNAVINSPMDLMLFAVDKNSSYLFFNENHKKKMKEIYGVNIKIGMNMLELIKKPERKKTAKKTMNRVFKRGSFKEVIHDSGNDDYWEFNWNPIKSEAGKIIGLTSISQNITKRIKYEERLQIMSSAVNSSINAIAIADLKGDLTYVNPQFLKMWGYGKEEEVIGKNASNFWQIKEKAIQVIDSLSKHGGWIGELTARRKDGSDFEVQLAASIISDISGQPVNMVVSFIDITEAKQAEKELHEAEQLFQRVSKNAKEFVFRINLIDERYDYCSPSSESIVGLSQKDLYDDPLSFQKVIHPDDFERIGKLFKKTIAKGKKTSYEFRAFHAKTGDMLWIHQRNFPAKGKQGKVISIEGLVSDITDQKIVEEQLIESNEIINASPAVVFLWKNEKNWPVEFVSDNVKEVFGYSSKDFISGKVTYFDVIHPEDVKRVSNEIKIYSRRKRKEDFTYLVYRIINKKGEVKFLEDRTYSRKDAHGNITHFQGIIIDITGRKRAEDLILLQRDLSISLSKVTSLNMALETCVVTAITASGMDCGGIYLFDDNSGDLHLVYQKALPDSFVREARHYAAGSKNVKLIKKGKPNYGTHIGMDIPEKNNLKEERLRALAILPIQHEGKVIACMNIASHKYDEIPDDARSILELISSQVGHAIAVTKSSEALKESEYIYRMIADNMTDVIYTTDLNLKFTYCSNSMERFLGYTPEEVLNKSLDDFFTTESLKYTIDVFTRELEEEKSGKIDLSRSQTIEVELIHKNGSAVWGEISASFLRDEKNNPIGVQGVVRDVTERKQAREKINSSLMEKETLLKEIHHRVKNNFQIINSLIGLQQSSIKDEKLNDMFRDLGNRILAMSNIHEKLYRSKDLSGIDFSDYIDTFSREIYNAFKSGEKNISLKTDAEKIIIDLDRAIPCGLIINELISNSLKYAFPDEFNGDREIRVTLTEKDNMVELVIADNGIGMPKDFDIKAVDSLGLQLVPSFVNQLQGEYELNCKSGTEFIIKFKLLH
ncbi:PAS domain S-box protein [Spirochaetota bacterium]